MGLVTILRGVVVWSVILRSMYIHVYMFVCMKPVAFKESSGVRVRSWMDDSGPRWALRLSHMVHDVRC